MPEDGDARIHARGMNYNCVCCDFSLSTNFPGDYRFKCPKCGAMIEKGTEQDPAKDKERDA